MRDQHDNGTIAVEIVVRHTQPDKVIDHRHEIVVHAGDPRPEWLNRRIVAATETAMGLVRADFGITADDLRLGYARDFHTKRPHTPVGGSMRSLAW